VAKLGKCVENRREHAEASCHDLIMVAVLLLLFGGTSNVDGLLLVLVLKLWQHNRECRCCGGKRGNRKEDEREGCHVSPTC
jgi:hypothetical protein